jgi:hypothetical protein
LATLGFRTAVVTGEPAISHFAASGFLAGLVNLGLSALAENNSGREDPLLTPSFMKRMRTVSPRAARTGTLAGNPWPLMVNPPSASFEIQTYSRSYRRPGLRRAGHPR